MTHDDIKAGLVVAANGSHQEQARATRHIVEAASAPIANATDAGSTQARLNDLLAALRAKGLIRT